MYELAAPKATLDAHGLRHKRRFGQNFLADRGIARRIAELSTTPPGGTVVEIGAGLGALTSSLLERASRVVAIERDRDLIPVLHDAFSDASAGERLEILEADAKQVDYGALFSNAAPPRVLSGNLPYQITGPLIELTVNLAGSIDLAVFMIQLEVAERLSSHAGEKAYGGLSVFVQAAFEVSRAFIVRRGAFYPQPNVDSAVVVLTPRRPPQALENEEFRALVHAAFAQRRKTLRNAWRGVLGIDRDALIRTCQRAGIDLDRRGETLDVGEFARMARLVEEAKR
jgi:16S rRNA (adenine1518-N6/adenine1519-N6)-dimethyltransferase